MLKIIFLMSISFTVFASQTKRGVAYDGPSTAPVKQFESTSSTSDLFSSSGNQNKTAVLLDLIGGGNGYSNLSIEFKVLDKVAVQAQHISRFEEKDNNNLTTVEGNGFLVTRYLYGDFGQRGIQAGLGPLSYIEYDRTFSKSIALAATLSGQIVAKDLVIVRLNILGTSRPSLNQVGLLIGLTF